MVLLQGPTGWRFLKSEVPLFRGGEGCMHDRGGQDVAEEGS